MRAILLSEFGPPEMLVPREVDTPATGPGRVAIAVEWAGVTFVETQVRAGRPPHPSMLPALPAIPGNGVGGVVSAVGPGVDSGIVGMPVVATTGGTGGYAELATVEHERVIAVPNGVSVRDAVALLADGRTAVALVQRATIAPGERVLIEAAAGGVGSLLVQLAARAAATVVGAAGGARKVEVARSLGADVAVDYSDSAWPARVAEALGAPPGQPCVDVVFDGVGGAIGADAFALLRAGGRYCGYGMASGAFTAIDPGAARDQQVTVLRGAGVDVAELTRLSTAALARAAAGEMHPLVGQAFPLERAADAHRAIEARATVGKTLLTVGAASKASG